MSGQHLVRIGVLGQVGRMAAVDAARYGRKARVLCRTERGLEVGEVLSAIDDDGLIPGDGTILRRLAVEDELLLARLNRTRDAAFAACERLLAERGLSDVLIDVEHLFDGGKLYFHFLGEPSEEAAALTNELAEAYETQAQIGQFADMLATGCGPGCGTEEAENGCGSGSGGCSSCAVLAACSRH